MDFISSEMFLSFAGCSTVVAILVQAIKQIPGTDKVNALWFNLGVSILVGIIRVCLVGDFTVSGITLGVINIMVIFLGATGGYETVKQIVQKVKGDE